MPFQALSMRIKLMAAGEKQPKLIGQNEVEPVALATQVTEAVSFEPWSSKGPWALSEKEWSKLTRWGRLTAGIPALIDQRTDRWKLQASYFLATQITRKRFKIGTRGAVLYA